MCVLCSRLLFPYLVRFRSLLVNSVPGVCVICVNYLVYLSPVFCIPFRLVYSSFPVFLLVIPGVSTLPCVTLMSSLKTIILKYFLVCVFLVSPWCVHRDRRPDQTVSVVPSPRFVLFVFSSLLFCSCVLSLAASESARSEPSCPPFAGVYAAVRGSPIPPFAGILAAVRGSAIPPFAGVHAAVRGSTSSQEMTPPSTANPSPPARL